MKFFTGTVVREVLVDLDDASRRLAWSIVAGEVVPDEQARCTSEMMERGTQTIKRTLEAGA